MNDIKECAKKIHAVSSYMKNFVMDDHPIIKDLKECSEFLESKPFFTTPRKVKNLGYANTLLAKCSNDDIIKERLQVIKNSNTTQAEILCQIVSDVTRVPVKELKNHNRAPYIVKARCVWWSLLRTELNLSFKSAGEVSGGHAHCTVLYGVKKIEECRLTDKVIREQINECLMEYRNGANS
jgi:hypothetical protein